MLVDKDSYLLEESRYVVLNPVRAGLCKAAGDWAWSVPQVRYVSIQDLTLAALTPAFAGAGPDRLPPAGEGAGCPGYWIVRTARAV